MGIFGGSRARPDSGPAAVVNGPGPGTGLVQQVPCDRCHVAVAKVEVITGAGSVFLCSHHHTAHFTAILAAGHRIRCCSEGL
jgi:hypothetical protein